MSTQTHTWSTVIDVVLRRDPKEGTYSLTVVNADESEAGSHDLDAVVERAALLEATAWVKSQGYEPASRYWSDDATRRFRRA